MNDILLLKLGEVVLKGLNRRSFEAKLVGNVRRRLVGLGKFNVSCMQSTVYVEPADDHADLDAAFEAVQDVFGVVKISRASACEKDKDAIVRLAIECLREDMLRAKSFKVESKRSDKRFPMTSIQLSQYVGGELAEAYPNCAVDVHNPELIVNVEIRDLAAYVHTQPVDGAGGMPVGSNGIAVSLLSGGIDSPVSTYMIAKRGVRLVPVHFFSFPYTSQQAKEKVIELGHLLTRYCGDMTLEVVPFTHCALYPYSGGDSGQMPGGILYPDHAALHDAHCRAHCRACRREGDCHRREPRPGCQPDHGSHGHDPGRDGDACAAAAGRNGQGGYRPLCAEDRDLRHLHSAL